MQVKPPCSFTPEEINYLTDRIQNGGTEVVEVKMLTLLKVNRLSRFLFSLAISMHGHPRLLLV